MLFLDGNFGTPSIAFTADQDTGIFRLLSDAIGFAAGGVKKLEVNGTGLRGAPYILAQSGALITHTGTVSATTLATVNVPANTLGANDSLRITAFWSAAANNANSKLATVRFGGMKYSEVSLASNLAARTESSS